MRRVFFLALLLCAWDLAAEGQDLDRLQIHGFATQGFLFSSNNNYLTMRSSSGSLQWTQGALNVSDSVTDKLRVGIQVHMYQMGQFGGPNVLVDWALGDYKFNDHLGIRAGKVKTPMGLFNDSQDIDSLFLWVLLPQGMYPSSDETFNLAELGGEVYGGISLGKRGGSLQYKGHVGHSSLDSNEGYVRQLADQGLTFTTPPNGKTFGADVRWMAPLKGFAVGAGLLSQALDGTGDAGSIHVAPTMTIAYYGQWDHGKLHLAGEYWRTPLNPTLLFGTMVVPMPLDQRTWYPMVSYQLKPKLQLGTYYSHYQNSGGDTSLPANYSKDWTVAGRYDFNPYFYGKIEGHFLHGTGLGYYTSTNPDGLKPTSKMLAARIGFSF
jgi:hypothetical protein